MTDLRHGREREAAVAALLRRIHDLLPEADKQTAHQHLVSRLLLDRFAVPGGPGSGKQVQQPFDVQFPDRRPRRRHPRDAGWVLDFVPFASASLEEFWNRVETPAATGLRALDDGALFDHPAHVQALQDLMALHWIRSHRYLALHTQSFAQAIAARRDALLFDGSGLLRAAAAEVTGLHVTGRQGLELVAEKLLAPSVKLFASGALLRARMEEMYEQAREFTRRAGLEVVVPQEGEFLIGDSPAITLRSEGNTVHYGMALGDAGTLVLPVGPRHLIALGPEHRELRIAREDVDRINEVQVRAAEQHVFCRPGSPLERFAPAAARRRAQG
ncbi:DUF4238 domain-containing protein [Kitasatospora aureofaciens]|uniref:DUF4238 domain-containing protein n=1 Tax=Kitasatospora aureofaciens TaxID=1894 RepID=UPI0033D04922